MMKANFRTALGLALSFCAMWLPGTQCQAEDPIDVLWYGNSFTNATCCGSTVSVPNMFRAIALSAGHPAPGMFNAAVNGQALQYHLTTPSQLAKITTGISAGNQWEFVVLQDFSTWPTHIGNLPQHLSSSLGLYQAVAAHSPGVVAVMYETWARGYGHTFYPGSFANPAAMQQELRDGYQMSTDNINTVAGMTAAKLAPAGDAWEAANWPANFYGDVNYHASNRGSLLNAMVLYGTMYNDRTISDINLSSVLGPLGLSAADGAFLASLAEEVLVPEPASGAMVLFSLLSLIGIRRRTGA